MAEELLNRPDVISGFEQVGGERVSESMTRCWLGNPRRSYGIFHRFLENGFVKMVAAALASLAVAVESGCWENPLPGPVTSSARVLPSEGLG